MIEQYAKLPKDSILMIAMADNPQLAAAYAASVHAENQEAKSQMQEKFRQSWPGPTRATMRNSHNSCKKPSTNGAATRLPSRSATAIRTGHQRGRTHAGRWFRGGAGRARRQPVTMTTTNQRGH